ncbi:MAG: O-antigen ligase family protein [Candidatus Sumerlaeota bacterium]
MSTINAIRRDSAEEMPEQPDSGSRFWNWYEWLGCGLLALIAFAVPLAVAPPTIFPGFNTDRSWIVEAKNIVLQSLAGTALIVASLGFVGPLWRRYRGAALLPVSFLLAYLAWGAVSVFTTPQPGYSLTFWLPHAFAIGAALTGPLFLRDEKKATTLLAAIAIAGLIAGLIGVVGGLGFRGFNRFFYGNDPRDLLEETKTVIRGVQGGTARSGSLSTLNNPEYAGGFAASIAAVYAVLFFDWAGSFWNKTVARFSFLICGAVLLLHLALTGTRQPWIALTLAGSLRLLLALRVNRYAMAGGFCVVVLAALGFGLKVGVAVAGLEAVALAITVWRNGSLRRLIAGTDRMLLVLLGLAPVALAFLLVAFSTPGPWNPTGLRIAQRFVSATSGTEESLSERSLMFSVASQEIRKHPLLGVGPGYYLSQFYPTIGELVAEDKTGTMYIMRERLGNRIAEQAHNDYLQIAAEQGVMALVIFLGAMVALLAGLVRVIDTHPGTLRRRLALAFLCCLVTYLGIMFTSFPLNMPERSAIFWCCVAGALGVMTAPREAVADEVAA